MADLPVGSVLLAPEPDDTHPGRPQHPHSPAATRIVKVAVAHDTEWPWRRLTGLPSELPARGSDLAGWRPQPWTELAQVLGHEEPTP